MVIQQKNQQQIISKINEWEKVINEKGYLVDEADLFSLMKNIDEDSNPQLISKLLTLAALSRAGRSKADSLGYAWMEKALTLNPLNQQAISYLAQNDASNRMNLFEHLTFPPLRETDNKQAKKKGADHYLSLCRHFLSEAELHLKNLHKRLEVVESLSNEKLIQHYHGLINLINEGIEIVTELKKATESFEQSLTGVFYHSASYDEMKYQLLLLEQVKSEWENKKGQNSITQETPELSSLELIQSMVGLSEVKERVNQLYRFLKYNKKRKELGFHIHDEIRLDMILTGNPGTGKTTLARLLAKIYYELGILPREEVIEADRSQLVGAFVGQTEENVRAIVEKALGGVLFIDEAYSLSREGQSGNDYGQTAIDTLVSLMTGQEYGGKFAVVLAGYPEEMRTFLQANPGLRSRFPSSNQIHLPNYSNEELMLIAEKVAGDNDYLLTDTAKHEIMNRLDKERVDETFGNARTVKNIIIDAIFKKGAENDLSDNMIEYTLLEKGDFELTEPTQNEVPSQRLQQLIGLQEVKNEVATVVSFVKIQQHRREHGLPVVPIQLHAVFSGNPGTGKTTVAKIYAELLKDCGILKRGHLVVASRADFVAGYVGQTAIKTKKKIRDALGGVLFIDEAYSLLGQTNGDFGREVIDTLVDEMTKHNENLVVVLAGYPNEMNQLLESNPGLRSRFKKFITFQDYTIEELLQIMVRYAGLYQYELTEEAKEYVYKYLQENSPKGNGRLATNVIDEAIQAQALRIVDEIYNGTFSEIASLIDTKDIKIAFKKLLNGD
ncbi:AAA family ATPase [Bacillus sp. T3]|uniref:AAA family ATPase n=1 Tax=Bacillus sp. T3 TaxID=467262 RepID=UPI00298155A5|nr:AAA family ATPase [Bacillus sp. T3]